MNQGAADQRRRLLGEFIRSRRERTTPEMVGMPPSLRRRTPGLRREEVAMLSGIGVTWYTWLEQGRPINVSGQVLGAVARVLQLDETERAHIFTLAELTEGHDAPLVPKVAPAIQMMLDQLDPWPAAVIGPHWEIVASNRAYVGLVGDYSALPTVYQNSMLLYFTDERWRKVMGDWEATAPRLVAKMRVAMASDVADPAWQRLLHLLEKHSLEFPEIWQRQEVAPLDTVVKTMHHDEVGTLRAEVVHSWLTDQRNVRLTVYTPLDGETRERFPLLLGVDPFVIPVPDTLISP
jgi:transcriptional regulator with XRE-family HTH domain